MNRKPTTKTTLLTLGLALALVAPAAWGIIAPCTRTAIFGVTARQTIEVSIVNTGDAKGAPAPYVRVLDLAGEVLFEALTREPLLVGEGMVFEIPAGHLGDGRLAVRVDVDLEGAYPGADSEDFLVGVEVVDDATGQTTLRVPATFVGR